MKFKLLALIGSMFFISGCDKVQSITGSSVKCDNETAKQLVVESFSKTVGDVAALRVKELVDSENITIDMGKLRSKLFGQGSGGCPVIAIGIKASLYDEFS